MRSARSLPRRLRRGAYLNFTPEDGVRDAYGPEKYARLLALKDCYDPENLSRLNQNIKLRRMEGEAAIVRPPPQQRSGGAGAAHASGAAPRGHAACDHDVPDAKHHESA